MRPWKSTPGVPLLTQTSALIYFAFACLTQLTMGCHFITQSLPESIFSVQCIAGDATVRLTVQLQLPFGESLKIAGSGNALGNWDAASAPSKAFCNGLAPSLAEHVWGTINPHTHRSCV